MKNKSVLLIVIATAATISLFGGGIRPAHAGQVTDWSITPNQYMQCYFYADPYGWKFCETISAEIKLDTVDNNAQIDYYQIVLTVYDLNGTACFYCTNYGVTDYGATVSFNTPNPGGVMNWVPQPGWVFSQGPVTLTYLSLSASVYIPSSQIDVSKDVNPQALTSYDWHVYSWCCNVFSDYAQQGMDLAVPKGQTWTVNFHYVDHSSYGVFFSHDGSRHQFDMTGSLTVTSDPSVQLSASPSSLYEMCYVTAYQCYTMPYGARPTSCYPSYCPPVPVCDTITLTNSGTSETYTMSASVPSGWGYSWQYQTVNLSGQATDCLSISAPYGLTTAGWYYITVNAVGSFGDVSTMTLPAYYWYYGAGGGGGCPCRLD